MKYISEIRMHTGATVPFMVYESGSDFTVTVHDTRTGRDTIVGADRLPLWKIHGVSTVCGAKERVVICHSAKSAMLYHHISVERHVDEIESVDFTKVDMCSLDVNDRVAYDLHGYRDLVLQVLMVPQLKGISGSVAAMSYTFIGRVDYYNLYDFIGMLCRRSKLNLMMYDYVVLSCRTVAAVGIRFKHNAAANRFFMKMYLDVMRDGAR